MFRNRSEWSEEIQDSGLDIVSSSFWRGAWQVTILYIRRPRTIIGEKKKRL